MTFGQLRPTGFESDRELHLAHNAGLPLADPTGGFYFVFLTGRPIFRKYAADGTLLFERHIEGTEIDALLDAQPTRWPRRRVEDREVPFVAPVIRAAAVSPRRRAVDLAGRARTPTSTTRRATRSAPCSSTAPGSIGPTSLVVRPRRHGARHARLLRVPVALTPADAGRGHAHQDVRRRASPSSGVSFDVARGRDLRARGAQRRRQDDDAAHAGRAHRAVVGHGPLSRRADGRAPRRRCGPRIGFLTEAPGLWDRLTVRQNLRVHARLHGLPQPDRAVDTAHGSLRHRRSRRRARGGAVEGAAAARRAGADARCTIPRVVLLDEPTSGLDPESARDVRELVLRLRHERRAVLISTHNLDEVDRLADRVARAATRASWPSTRPSRCAPARSARASASRCRRAAAALRRGRCATPALADVREDGRHAVDRPRAPAAAARRHIVRRLVEAGADIEAVEPEEPSLEQVYLRLLKGERP